MSEDIKEILEYPTIYNFDDEPYLHGTDYVKLRDYITNLQQENERLKEQINNIKKLDRMRFNMLISHYGILEGNK